MVPVPAGVRKRPVFDEIERLLGIERITGSIGTDGQ